MATQQGVSPRVRGKTAEESSATHRFIELQSKLLGHYRVTATSRFVEIDRPKMRVHLLEAGEGEPIVLLHGGDGEAVDWAPLMAKLQKQAHVFAVDRPGNGLSDAFDYRKVDLRSHASDFMESLLDVLDLPSATLVGGSMGGFFVLSAALSLPHRVRRIILAGYPAGMTKVVAFPLRIIGGVPGLARRFMSGRPSLEAQKKQYQRMFHVDPSTVPDLYFETRIAGIELPSAQGTWATLLPRIVGLSGIRREVYLGDELNRIQAPALVLWGEWDMASAAEGKAMTSRIPEARFEYLPGVGHFPFLEDPDRCGVLISDFMAST